MFHFPPPTLYIFVNLAYKQMRSYEKKFNMTYKSLMYKIITIMFVISLFDLK